MYEHGGVYADLGEFVCLRVACMPKACIAFCSPCAAHDAGMRACS
jgi:hypothetical protein